MARNMLIELDVNEAEQSSSRQNGTLQTAVEGIAMTVETYIDIPSRCKTQDEVAKYLERITTGLGVLGIKFNVAIDNSCDVIED